MEEPGAADFQSSGTSEPKAPDRSGCKMPRRRRRIVVDGIGGLIEKSPNDFSMKLSDSNRNWSSGSDERVKESASIVAQNDRLFDRRTPHLGLSRNAGGHQRSVESKPRLSSVEPPIRPTSESLGKVDHRGMIPIGERRSRSKMKGGVFGNERQRGKLPGKLRGAPGDAAPGPHRTVVESVRKTRVFNDPDTWRNDRPSIWCGPEGIG